MTLLAALMLPLTTSRRAAEAHVPPLQLRQALGAMLRARRPLLLALMFTTYNLQFFSVMTFLPIFLMQRIGLSLAAAGGISAAAVAANIIGNLAAGLLLSRGLRAGSLLAATSLIIGIFGIGIFLPMTPNGLLIPFVFPVLRHRRHAARHHSGRHAGGDAGTDAAAAEHGAGDAGELSRR